MPIVAVLALSFTSLTVLAVGGALILGLHSADLVTKTLLRERASATINQTVDGLLAHVQPVIDEAKQIGAAVANGSLDPNDATQLRFTVLGAAAGTPQVAAIAVVHPDCHVELFERGMGRLAQPDWAAADKSCPALEWARAEAGLRWLAPHFNEHLNRSVIAVEQPLRSPHGFAGTLIISVSLAELTRFLEQNASPGQSPFILYGADSVVAPVSEAQAQGKLSVDHPLLGLSEIGDPVLAHLSDATPRPMSSVESVPGTEAFQIGMPGGDVHLVYRELDAGTERNWRVGTHYRGSLGEAEMRKLQITAGLGLVVLLLALILTLAVGRWLSQPMRHLAAAAAIIEREDFEAFRRLEHSLVAEFDRAAGAFNAMVTGLIERERIRRLFGRYVPAAVVKEMLAQAGDVQLGGEKRDVSLLFADIANFTTVSEALAPEILVERTNLYFQGIGRIVAEHGGIVVDFIGDGTFAMFGAPVALENHAKAAIACARAIHDFTNRFAADQSFGLTRIGIHSGETTVGNFGSIDRLKFTAIGDLVNTTARLEGANKAFGTLVLAAGDTIERAGETLCRPIGDLVFKGKTQPLAVLEILSNAPPWLEAYRRAYRLLEAGDPQAIEVLREISRQAPDDGLIATLLARAEKGEVTTRIELSSK
jgi:class 3 adenylate cyclase